MREHNYAVYIITNKNLTTFYIEVTSDLEKRMYQHKIIRGFSSRYNLNKLVFFECTSDIYEAITREKQLKNWRREWKLDLIREKNPLFLDLFDQIN